VSIGDALAAARREAGLTITQVSQRTCIRETIVRGIERGDYSACGGDFYARGHIRSIARAVGLDPEDLIREYDATQAPPKPISAADVFQPFTPVKLKERRRPNWSVVLLAGLVAVLGIVGFRYYETHNSPQSQHSRQTASTLRAHHRSKPPVKTTPVVHVAPDHVRLVLAPVAGGVSWAEITTASGNVVYEGDVTAKVTRTEKDTVTLQLGNPAGVTVYLNGKKQSIETAYSITLSCSKVSCTQLAPVG
jgi:cytoskeletal protein RodZ